MTFKLGYITRHADIIPEVSLGLKINVVGAGAIGSHAIMALARMGFGNITVWDYDEVDPINMNCQGFTIADIGKPKVEALARHVEEAIGFKIHIENKMWKFSPLSGVVICAADSMEVRKNMWKACRNASHFIDPRMGAELAQLYVMKPNNLKDEEAYPKTLFPDSEAVRAPCTAKSTIYTAYLLSGLVAKVVKDIAVSEKYTRIIDWNIRKNIMQSWLVS